MGKADDLLSEFVGLSDPRGRGQKCTAGRLEKEFTPAQRESYGAAMVNPNITNRAIADVVTRWGYGVLSSQIVRRHRNGECACVRT